MPPEDIAALAALHGLPVEHFDGHSVVHTPDGPMPIVHAPAAAPPPRRIVLPAQPELRITAPSAERQARIAADDAAIERDLATTAARGRTPEQERQRELQYVQDRAPTLQRDGSLPPKVQRDLDRWTTERARESEVSAMAGSGRLAREQDRRALVEEGRFPTAGQTYDPQAPIVIPPEVPASWLPQDAMLPGLREGARSAIAADEAMQQRAPVSAASVPRQAADASRFDPVVQGPTRDGGYIGGPQPAPTQARPPIATRAVGPELSADGLTLAQPRAVDTSGIASYMPGGASYQARDVGPDSLGGQPIGMARRAPDAIDRASLIEQQRAGLAQKAAQTQLGIEQQAEQQRQQLEQDRQAAVRQAQQRYQNATQRVSDARLDPQRWFRDQGAGGTVAATIAVTLGALGQALTGSSTNSALDQINQAIDRDMQAQQSEIDGARAGADLAGNMLNITRQEFSDRQAAHDAARAGMLQQAALHVQEMEGSLAGQEAQVNAEAMRAQLEQQAAEARAAAEERQSQIDLRQAQTLRELQNARIAGARADRMEHGGGGAGHPFQASAPMFQTFEAALASGFPREQAALLAGFPAGVVPQHSSSTAEQRSTLDAFDASLSRLEQASSNGDIPGVGLFDSRLPGPEGRLMRDEIQNTVDLLGRLRSGAAISAAEEERFMTILGAGEWQTEDQFRAGLARIRRELDARLGRSASQGSAVGREHAEAGFTPDEA